MKRLVAIALALIGLSVGVGGCLGERRGTGVSRAVDLIPRGGEQPLPGATFDNGFNILTLGPCDFARAYADAKLFTGPPIAAFDGRGQSFYFLRLVCAPTDPHAQVTFENLGAQALLARGMVRLPDSEPHPVVRAFLVDAQQAGLDTRALFGRVLSPPLCRGARCQQYPDNVLLEFDGSDPETPVRFAPLG